jgi:hypothetical protein
MVAGSTIADLPVERGSGTVTYGNFFPAFSEAALVTATASTVAGNTWNVSDMNGTNVGSQGSCLQDQARQ